jgi:hypothetical protein
MTLKPDINPKYKGDEIVAIVKVGDRYEPRGTYEHKYHRDVVLLPGCDRPARKVASVTIPGNTLRGELVRRLQLFEMLERYEKNGDLYAVFLGVGPDSVQPIVKALNKLNEGKQVDLDSILS